MTNKVYCVKCKRHTENSGKLMHHKTKNGHKYITVKCKVCGSKKAKMI